MTGRFVNPALNPKLIDLLQNRPAQLAGSRGHAYVIRINSVCIVIYNNNNNNNNECLCVCHKSGRFGHSKAHYSTKRLKHAYEVVE